MHTYNIMLIAAQMLNYFRLHGCMGVTFPQWLSNFLLHTSIAVCVYDQPHARSQWRSTYRRFLGLFVIIGMMHTNPALG